MPAKKRLRKILLGIGILFLLFVLLLASVPLWLPWALGPLGKKYGLHYSHYQRLGYERFALDHPVFTNQTTALHAQRVEALVPTVWLWKHYFGMARPQTFLSVSGWQLEISKAPPQASPEKPTSSYDTVDEVNSTLATLRQWLPGAFLTNGVIQLEGVVLQVPQAAWKDGVLSANLALPKYHQDFTVNLNSTTPGQSEIRLEANSLHLLSTIHVHQTANGLDINSTNSWLNNPVTLNAHFNREADLPEEASFQAVSFQVPAAMLQLNDYSNVTGSLSARWQKAHFALDLSAQAKPLDKTEPLSLPIDVNLHARGDTQTATIETAKIIAPGLTAELSEGVQINFQGPLLTNPVALNVAADLSRQSWVEDLRGMIQGQLTLAPDAGKYPRATFNFKGSDIKAQSVQLKTASLQGELIWPLLEPFKLDATFADGSSASLTAKANVQEQTIQESALQFSGPFGRQFLPAGYAFDHASFSANFTGPLTNLSHTGLIKVEQFSGPNLPPLNMEAKWSGLATNSLQSEIAIVAGNSSLALKSSVASDKSGIHLSLENLTLQTNGQPALTLEKPCHVTLLPHPAVPPLNQHFFVVKLDSFDLIGKSNELRLHADVTWPQQGNLAGSIRLGDPSLFTGFFTNPLPDMKIESLNFSSGWTNGPMNLALTLAASGMVPQNVPISANADISGNGEGIVIKNLLVTSGSQPIFTANGSLPVVITPNARTNLLNFVGTKTLQFHAMTQTNSIFWDKIASLAGVVLRDPQLDVDVSGSLQSPQGHVILRAARLTLPDRKTRLPSLENLDLAISLTKESLRLDHFSLSAQGQPVHINGEVPLGQSFWTAVARKPQLPDWQKATARLEIQNAQITAFAPLLPGILTPQGVLNADISLLPGIKLQGKLTIDGAQTRPFPPVGAIQDIHAEVNFVDRAVQLKANVSLGSESVLAQGNLDLRGDGWLKGALPPFNIKIQGTNVPLARQPELVLRGNLDVSVTRTNDRPAVVAGTVQLRDSFLLEDLASLVPRGTASPAERPPYFSITDPLLEDWRLNLTVKGTRFMKIQDPLFKGEASLNIKLQGTLKDPMALGEVKIDSGSVQFPFGDLQVSHGFVSLTPENPYMPQLLVSAGSRQFGYDLKLDVTGPVDHPVIQFTSIPPLDSEQVLLMLTAGQLPRNDFSFSAQQRAQTLALFLGKNLLSKFGLGGSGSDRLTFKSGEDISEEGKPTYDVEYRLTKKWSLVGEYDRFGDFNGGFKWLIYSR